MASRAARVAAVVGLLASGWALARRAGRRSSASTSTAAPSGVSGLTAPTRLGRLAAVSATSAALATVDRARLTGRDAQRDPSIGDRPVSRTYEDVAAALADMKGGLMKVGQMASFMDPALPEPFRAALRRLQQDAPGMAPELARGVVERELGAPPDELFAWWDPEPFAAASIGQVHRALTQEGRAVAVKVQYPGIAEAIEADLGAAGLLFSTMRGLFPGLDTGTLLDEVRGHMAEELDYRKEADNQELFATAYLDHPHIHVPRVDRSLSSRRVLTSELVEGTRFTDASAWSREERDLAAETIYRFVFASIYRLHAFNGDPHPGNYLLHGGGRVTFLDFGVTKRFAPEEIDQFSRMTRAMVWDRDLGAFRAVIEEAGFLPPGLPVDDEAIGDFFGHFYDFLGQDRELTITPAFASETLRRYFDAQGTHRQILRAADIPRSMIVVQRINLGLHAVLSELEATANWRRIGESLWPWSGRSPETALGRADQAWLAERA